MKNLVSVGIVCSFIISIMGCSNSQAGSYDSDEAIKRGDIVSTPIGNHNLERFEQFLTNFSNKNEDTIRITGYTLEGDPIFRDLQFDGQVIHYTYDNSFDQYGEPEKTEDVCKGIRAEETEAGYIEFMISQCSTTDDHYLIQVNKGEINFN